MVYYRNQLLMTYPSMSDRHREVYEDGWMASHEQESKGRGPAGAASHTYNQIR